MQYNFIRYLTPMKYQVSVSAFNLFTREQNMFQYNNTSLLLKNTPFVKFIRNYSQVAYFPYDNPH